MSSNVKGPISMYTLWPLNYQELTWLPEKLLRMWNPHPRTSCQCGHKSGNSNDERKRGIRQTHLASPEPAVVGQTMPFVATVIKRWKGSVNELDSWNMPGVALRTTTFKGSWRLGTTGQSAKKINPKEWRQRIWVPRNPKPSDHQTQAYRDTLNSKTPDI